MPHARNTNHEFAALPVRGRNELADTPCAICPQTASVRLRADGWIGIHCTCGYTECALGEHSFNALMSTILNEPKTVFLRAQKSAVMAALGIGEPEPKQVEDVSGAQPEAQLDATTQDSEIEEIAPVNEVDETPPQTSPKPEPEPEKAQEVETVEDDDHAALFGE